MISTAAIATVTYSMGYQFKCSASHGCFAINVEETAAESATFKVKNHAFGFDIIDTERSATAQKL